MQKITPFLWFDGNIEKAVKFYASVFKGTKLLGGHGAGAGAMSASIRVNGQDLILFNGGPHYKFSPAISLFISCHTQKEVDYYWERLAKGGKKGRCGWLSDPFGLSWQVVPDTLGELMGDKDPVKAGRVMQAMMKMDKLDIKGLKAAHAGKR
jgi:predicted 3-demethylubiquinone-9 3-methyltransferase (glyoxalase superfamily)